MRAATARRAAVALLAVVTLAGCGGSTRAQDVDRYVRAANKIQSDAAPRFATIADSYKRYADNKLSARTAIVRLTQAEALIAQTRNDLTHLEVPPDARRLHALLLRTYDQTILFAGELRELAVYVPAAKAELGSLDAVRLQLRNGLRSGRKPARQAAVLRRYAAQLRVRIRHLRALQAPPVLAPTADAQIGRLERTRGLALGLVGALRAADGPRITRLLKRFRTAGDTSAEQQRLASAAFRAYDARRIDLQRLASQVRQERARLVRTLK